MSGSAEDVSVFGRWGSEGLTSSDSGAVRGQSLVPAGDEGGDLEGGGGQDGDGQRHRDYWSDGPRHQQQVGRLVAVAAGEERQRNCCEWKNALGSVSHQ